MDINKLFDSFCLEGKITEAHAKEIKDILHIKLKYKSQDRKGLITTDITEEQLEEILKIIRG